MQLEELKQPALLAAGRHDLQIPLLIGQQQSRSCRIEQVNTVLDKPV
jgi:hypothetical protein